MKNRYSAKCERCGQWVDPGKGEVERYNGQWCVYHDECWVAACEDNKRKHAPREEEQAK